MNELEDEDDKTPSCNSVSIEDTDAANVSSDRIENSICGIVTRELNEVQQNNSRNAANGSIRSGSTSTIPSSQTSGCADSGCDQAKNKYMLPNASH